MSRVALREKKEQQNERCVCGGTRTADTTMTL